MFRFLPVSALTVALMGPTAGCAANAPITVDPGFLDRVAAARVEARGPQPTLTLPPAPEQVLLRPTQVLVCMSAKPWSPVYDAPSVASRVVLRATPSVAVTTNPFTGFVQILLPTGRGYGYLSATEVAPFQSDIRPGVQCTIALRRDGRPVFEYE